VVNLQNPAALLMSESSARRPLAAAAWMTTAQVAFAAMAVGARVGGSGVPWQEVCATRFVVGALTAYAVARVRGQSLRITRRREAWLRSAFGTLSAAGTFFVFAAPALALGDAATLFATSPIFVALLSAPLLGERVPRGLAFALVLGFAGIGLVAQPSFSTAGHLVAVGAMTAVSSALAMIWLRRIGPNESSEAIVFHFACVGSCVMILASLLVWRTPTPREALVLAGTGLCGGLGQLLMTRAYALDRAARVSALGYSGVVFTRALGLALLGELPTPTQGLGSLLVIGSGVLLSFGETALARFRRPPPGPAR
jgi:drug/metabolite transporter (DMT)-like permease